MNMAAHKYHKRGRWAVGFFALIVELKRYVGVVTIGRNPEALSTRPSYRWYQCNAVAQMQSGVWAKLLVAPQR